MNLKSVKLNKDFLKNLPFTIEKFEVFIILAGVVIVSLFAGLIFYERAYKIIISMPEVVSDAPKVNSALFEKTAEELEQRKQMAPDLPIIDPFR